MLNGMRTNLVFGWILLAFATSFCLFAVQSADVLMYFAIVRDLWANGKWDAVDPYLYSLSGAELHWSHQYLSILIFDQAYKFAGAAGIILLKAFVWAWGLFIVLKSPSRDQNKNPVWIALFVLATIAASFRFIERGSLFSDVFTVALIYWLSNSSALNKKLVVKIWVLFAIWIQLHAGYPVGLALLALWVLSRILIDRAMPARQTVWLLCLVPLAFLHPLGLRGFLYPFAFSAHEAAAFRGYNFEWFSSYSATFRSAPEVIAYFVLSGLSLTLLAVNRVRSFWVWTVSLFCIASGLYYVRFIPWAAFGLLVATKNAARLPKVNLEKRWIQIPIGAILVGITVKNLTLGYYSSSGHRKPQLEFDSRFFPFKTYEFWRANRIPGRLFAIHDFGNYISWQSGGPVFHHGFVTNSDFYLNDVIGVFRSRERFLELAKKYDWTMLLIDKNTSYRRFYELLSPLKEWQIVSEDDASYLIYKIPPKN